MTPTLLRQFWSVVEKTQTSILLNLDDAALTQWLLRQISTQRSLNNRELSSLRDYIHSRLALIRDLATERQSSTLIFA